MTSVLRKAVSKKKRRYQKNGYDLDLSYITDRIIAMGFPSEKMEGVYRNPMKEVYRFLEQFHQDHYRVYNLCSERSYDAEKFHNRVGIYPFDDHNAPPFDLLYKFCVDVDNWLKADDKNVAVIHCKAGKGRTGVMICAYLMFSKLWPKPQEALNFYAAMRTFNQKGVTIPSQLRYVHYFGSLLAQAKTNVEPRPLLLRKVEFRTLPMHLSLADIRFQVFKWKTLIYTHRHPAQVLGGKRNSKGDKSPRTVTPDPSDPAQSISVTDGLVFDVPSLPVVGDVQIQFFSDTAAKQLLFAAWFNTAFVADQGFKLDLARSELDKGAKDKKHFGDDFRLVASFDDLDPSASEELQAERARRRAEKEAHKEAHRERKEQRRLKREAKALRRAERAAAAAAAASAPASSAAVPSAAPASSATPASAAVAEPSAVAAPAQSAVAMVPEAPAVSDSRTLPPAVQELAARPSSKSPESSSDDDSDDDVKATGDAKDDDDDDEEYSSETDEDLKALEALEMSSPSYHDGPGISDDDSTTSSSSSDD
eukprot:TRINITY_DN4807_c0_g2_i1.p1 TRINITY_DN4807_c0_g2~~TRINITY_DN4807_c0_g2_i1.p1  ORF type:complete len:535 (-),score=126.41 TRINITY_DN4807_c0_g2_i1:503-2107(-)